MCHEPRPRVAPQGEHDLMRVRVELVWARVGKRRGHRWPRWAQCEGPKFERFEVRGKGAQGAPVEPECGER